MGMEHARNKSEESCSSSMTYEWHDRVAAILEVCRRQKAMYGDVLINVRTLPSEDEFGYGNHALN
jgi:hypothetical protein